jgi:hypothetical protein
MSLKNAPDHAAIVRTCEAIIARLRGATFREIDEEERAALVAKLEQTDRCFEENLLVEALDLVIEVSNRIHEESKLLRSSGDDQASRTMSDLASDCFAYHHLSAARHHRTARRGSLARPRR